MPLTPRATFPRSRKWLRRFYERWEEWRLRSLLPRQPATTGLLGRPLRLVDGHSFLTMHREIMVQEVYRFRSTRENPTILDCGANIGLAAIYWKQQYPAAHIIAFEPDPTIFQALDLNCRQWELEDVELIKGAVWTETGEMSFWPEGSDSGRLLLKDEPGFPSPISVGTVRLRDYLQLPIDLLKLDVEGAETDVLADCADHLDRVQRLFVEYHSFIGQPQRLNELLGILRSAGIRIYVQPQIFLPSPFVHYWHHRGMDQTLNIFACRG